MSTAPQSSQPAGVLTTITLTGADERTPVEALQRLLDFPSVEIGLLYTATPADRNRYPSRRWLQRVAPLLAGRCALHICGGGARDSLVHQLLGDIVGPAARIQVNGLLDVPTLERICASYPDKTILTQHYRGNEPLLQARSSNHAVLVDGSGGRGVVPQAWRRPLTDKPVGFAGGLGPDNLREQLPWIAHEARGEAWVDMESRLRGADDWFVADYAIAAAKAFERWVAAPTQCPARPQGDMFTST